MLNHTLQLLIRVILLLMFNFSLILSKIQPLGSQSYPQYDCTCFLESLVSIHFHNMMDYYFFVLRWRESHAQGKVWGREHDKRSFIWTIPKRPISELVIRVTLEFINLHLRFCLRPIHTDPTNTSQTFCRLLDLQQWETYCHFHTSQTNTKRV